MSSITKSVDVNVPVRTAYDQWTQFESFPEFMEGVEQVQQLDDKNLHWRAKVGGNVEEWDAVITEQNPDERVAWRSTDGKTNAGVVTFHRLGEDQTRVTVQMEWEPEGIAQHVGSTLGVDDRHVQGDLERFKAFIEERGAPTGAWRGQVNQPHTS
ncbi:MAG TPA: SRPBCC family protein [Chloroflexota bacterium]